MKFIRRIDAMSQIVDEMEAIFNSDKNVIAHYGMPRRSGRYPWGSGEDPYQHGASFLGRVDALKKKGWSETPENIMKEFGLTTTQYRTEKSNAKDEVRCHQVATAKSLQKDGLGATEIGRKMGLPESTVRSLLDSNSEIRMNQAKKTADFLKEQLKEKKMIDVGTGVERELGISKEKFNKALSMLEEEGYPIYKGGIPQATNPGKQTNQKVLCLPGTEHKDIYDYSKVKSLTDYVSHDDGETFDTFVYPKSMSSKRLMIRYKDDVGPDGARGIDKDGVIELRRGVPDLSLGESRYSQVRILVDGKKYLKGMAVYSDDMPDGIDVIFNTNKTKDKGIDGTLKDIKSDPENPFGSLIKPGGQSYYIDKDGKRQLSLINKRADEGDWSEWSNGLPSQFLSKQSINMAKKQLDIAKADKQAEFNDICSLTNPTIKKYLLNKFADECDSAAVHLKAAALPGQKYHVIIPINTLKDNEIYAPNYKDGTKLALIRYPHGGTFEIPICTVNNKNPLAKKLLGSDVGDAVGINAKVAERLSGADFDGDTVMCIPTHDRAGKVKIASVDPKKDPDLQKIVGFDPKMEYPERKGMKYMKDPVTGKDSTQMEMGKISNLITDMTLGGASNAELVRAVKHSMVVIDAGKHKLDYKQSEVDNNIKALREKYQRTVDADGNIHIGGASTIISRASGEQSVLKRQGSPYTNLKGKPGYDPTRPEGALIYKTADNVSWEAPKINKRTGEVTTETRYKTQASTRMAETDNAYSLVSSAKHPMEMVYADYANSMKNLANKARIESANTGKIAYSKSANNAYKEEVRSLKEKLNAALLNNPREREAQRIANAKIARIKEEAPDMKKSDIKKASQRELNKARTQVGSVSRRNREIDITDNEWKAIQAGAVSENILKNILNNSNIDKLRERATPRGKKNALSDSQIIRMKALSASYTIAQIADKMGISPSTVSKYLKGVG